MELKAQEKERKFFTDLKIALERSKHLPKSCLA
jgi:hypothetical protein